MTKENIAFDQPANAQSELMTSLLSTELFFSLDVVLLRELAENLSRSQLSPGEQLIKQGDPGDAMYIILSGQLRVATEGEDGQTQFRRIVGVHETIGEIALLTGQTRTATVIADSQVEVAKLSKASFDQLTNSSPLVADALADAITQLIRQRQLRTVLNATPFFMEMDDGLRQGIEGELELVSLRGGEMLFRQSDPSDSMYVVVSGRLQVVLENEVNNPPQSDSLHGKRVLSELGHGETLGEISLLTSQPRTATVYAIRDTEVAKLTRSSYERLMVNFPLEVTRAFVQPITNLVISRDQQDSSSLDQIAEAAPLTIALIPIRPDVTLTEFAQRLAKAFAQVHPAIHLNSNHVDRALGKEAISQTIHVPDLSKDKSNRNAIEIQLVNWLGELESNYRYLLYEADPTLTPWTLRSLRQADHVLFVGEQGRDGGHDGSRQGGGNSLLDDLENMLQATTQQSSGKKQSLVFIQHSTQKSSQKSSQKPEIDMAGWLAKRQTQNQNWQSQYQINWHEGEKEFIKLARLLSGELSESELGADSVGHLARPPSMDLVGKKLGKYKIAEFLGRGGMASVYKAVQPGVERNVAIKVMHPHLATSLDFVGRFRREARGAGSLNHPNIISVIDYDMEAGLHYMVLNYVQGGTLEELLQKKKILAAEDALPIAEMLGEALSYAHEKGMIHRDIKPANIMFFDKSYQRVLLADFGIARLQDDDADGLTVTGSLIGTPNYMSPEASQGQIIDERSDIYSFGVVLYEMMTGQTPYQATNLYTFLMKQANEPPLPPREINPEVPESINQLIMQLLENDPDKRFSSVAAVVDAIREQSLIGDGIKKGAATSVSYLKQNESNQRGKSIKTRLWEFVGFREKRVNSATLPKRNSLKDEKGLSTTGATKARSWVLLAIVGTIVLVIALLTVFLLLWVDPAI